ncbi:cystathionine beta-lyase [Trichoderma harzianum]|uniref:Cystathionine beta-lyase n=1 Tax=Trichoderma harzianum TaxID=5544 RepID=A0A0F9ZSD4_TRIHA|nr:cystathionine beta-lyase [Trichoderma harzianum]
MMIFLGQTNELYHCFGYAQKSPSTKANYMCSGLQGKKRQSFQNSPYTDLNKYRRDKRYRRITPSLSCVYAWRQSDAVTPALHTSTTYRFADDPHELIPFKDLDAERALGSHAHARYTSPNMAWRLFTQFVLLNPRRIAIGEGYHGCHGVIKMVSRMTGLETLPPDCDADKAHKAGAFLTVDATFGPPPLQNPFDFGADIVLHSGTNDRVYLRSVADNMESWLGTRSLRTLELRITRQSVTATALVSWLHGQLQDPPSTVHRVVEQVEHASLQAEATEEDSWLRKQVPNGYGPVVSIPLKDAALAKRLPSKLCLFQHATSLGGVESLIEWRAMTNTNIDERLVRLSVGVEALEDLTRDLQQGLETLGKEKLPEKEDLDPK